MSGFWAVFLFVVITIGGGAILVAPGALALIAAAESWFDRWNVPLAIFAFLWLAFVVTLVITTGAVDLLRELAQAGRQ